MNFSICFSQVMSEVLTGIRVIKFYAWENNFTKKILGLRYDNSITSVMVA